VRIDRRLLGWGAFLVIAGAIPLLVRGGYLTEATIRPWPTLWPVLLIGWGLALVLRRTPVETLANALNVIVLGVMAGGLIATGFGGVPAFGACGDGNGGSGFARSSGTLDGSNGRLSIEFNCGSLAVSAVDGAEWAVSGTGPEGRGPEVDADGNEVSISPPERDFMPFADAGSDWRIEVPRTPLLDLGVTLNAGDGNVDLGGANLGGVSVTLNAGSLTMGLGAAASLARLGGTVNAGSATFDLPQGIEDINLTLNAGSITVCLPAETNLAVSWSGALGANNFDEAGLVKTDDQHWMTGGDPPGPRVELDVSANAGSFTLDLGGTCDA
jgi:hypothetical protein